MVGKPGMKWSSPERISEARRLKALGRNYEQIKEATGLNLASISRYTKDVVQPKTHAQVTKGISTHERERRRATIEEKQGTTNYAVSEDGAPEWVPTTMPDDPSEFDTGGLFPDPRLLDHAVRLLKGWEQDRARGVVHERRPPAVSQALLVVMHDNRIWDYQAFLRDRDNWKTVRELAGVSAGEFGERVGLGASSIGRYEKNQRQPDSGQLRTLHVAYAACLEEAISKTELMLACDSAYEHFAHEAGVSPHEVQVDGDQLLRWVSGVGPEMEHYYEEVDGYDHLTHLMDVRQLLPQPDWRKQDEVPFSCWGYAQSADTEDVA